jgi:DNA-binding NarL/FixJ family response regulator
MTIRIVIADDHSVVRQGVIMALGMDSEMVVVGEAADGSQAIDLVKRERPDVVLMDLLMPVIDGLEATSIIRSEMPDTEVVILTSALDDDSVLGAARAGAIGYLVKDSGSDAIRRAVRRAADKQVDLPPAVTALLVRELRAPSEASPLSPREIEVLTLIGQGYVNREIARRLGVREGTVSAHVTRILFKLELQSRTQAAVHAVRLGLVQPDTLQRKARGG